jgi:hypothetical protein
MFLPKFLGGDQGFQKNLPGGSLYFGFYCIYINKFFKNLPRGVLFHPLCASMVSVQLKYNTSFNSYQLTIGYTFGRLIKYINIKQWLLAREFCECKYSPKICVFVEYLHSPKRPFSKICETRQTCLHLPSRVARTRGLARLADTRQVVLRGLARLAKGEFGKCYANLANLACLANLASVG